MYTRRELHTEPELSVVRMTSGNFLNVCMLASRGQCSVTNVLRTLAELHECLGCVSRDVHETYVCWGLLSGLPAA